MNKRAFTLVEIMIVVVIIGALAALSIPAFRKVRNNAIEKSMLNDARQVSSVAQQHASENALSEVPVSVIAKTLPNLGSGTILVDEGSGGPWGTRNGDLSSSDYAAMSLRVDGTFGLINENYSPSLSSNATVSTASYANGLRFSVSTGQLASW